MSAKGARPLRRSGAPGRAEERPARRHPVRRGLLTAALLVALLLSS